jgi:hypothetical protein
LLGNLGSYNKSEEYQEIRIYCRQSNSNRKSIEFIGAEHLIDGKYEDPTYESTSSGLGYYSFKRK